MITLSFNEVKAMNVENLFQLTVLKGNIGAEISRTEESEQIYFDQIEYHPENSKMTKTLYPFMFFQGKVEIGCEWEDKHGITEEDVAFGLSLAENYVEYNPDNVTTTSNSFQYISDFKVNIPEWTERSLQYEFRTDKSWIKAVEDETIIVCLYPKPELLKDFTYKYVDIQPNETIETVKSSGINFLVPSQNCEIQIPTEEENQFNTVAFNMYDVKKLTSDKCYIKNISDKKCRVILVNKN